MTRIDGRAKRLGWIGVAAAVSLTVALAGCGLDEVDVPEIDGPAELGTSIRLQITPDVITADGFSTALITATVFGPNGRGVSGRDIFFAIADESGRFADIGLFRGSNGPGTGVTARTNSAGVAQVVYESPVRTDATANQTVLIMARPVGDDAAGAIYRSVRLELRSAEPRQFPQNPGNLPPICNFVVEIPNGLRSNTAILFQSTSSDPDGTIVRYEWYWGDGSAVTYAPDTAHVFRSAGTYTVTHQVTDDDGTQRACAASLPVQP